MLKYAGLLLPNLLTSRCRCWMQDELSSCWKPNKIQTNLSLICKSCSIES